MKELDNIIARHNRINDSTSRIMIFVPFLDTGKIVAQHLGCDFYHSQPLGDNSQAATYLEQLEEKDTIYNNWYKGRKPDGRPNNIIVATTALSAGNDYPSVRLVIHLNTPIEMSSYIQEVSRAGRDGKPATCILLPISKYSSSKTPPEEDYKGLSKMQEYVFTEADCFHYAITSHSDGVGVYCHDSPTRQKCSLCLAKPLPQRRLYCGDKPIIAPTPSAQISLKRKHRGPKDETIFMVLSDAAKNRRAQQEMEKIEYVSRFNKALAIFNSSCAYCLMKNQVGKSHTLQSCSGMESIWTTYKSWKSAIKYPKKFPNKSCFFCHIPRIGNLLHENVGKPTDCDFPDIVAVVALGVYLDRELHQEAATYFKTSWKTTEEFSKWLIMLPTDKNLTHISALFLWYTKRQFDV